MQPRQIRDTSNPVRPSFTYSIVPTPLSNLPSLEPAPSTYRIGSGEFWVTGKGLKNLSPTHTADFGPDLEFFGPGCSVVGGSDMIAAEMEEVVDLIDDRQTVYAQECYESSEAAA